MKDWEKNPEKYLTNSDGSYILNKDGIPRKKGGRPKNSELSDVQLAIQAKKICLWSIVRHKCHM